MTLSRVAYVELVVPDIARSVAYAAEVLGLRTVETIGTSVYLTCNERHHELVLTEGNEARLAGVALEAASSAALDEICGKLLEVDVRCEDATVPGVARAKRFTGPGGMPFELVQGMESTEPRLFNSVAQTPRKFGHATVVSSHAEELAQLICGPLGFLLSDEVPGVLSWYRCNPDHHGMAIAPGPRDGLHHYAFEVEGWGSVEAFADHLAVNGTRLIWGPGRHGPGRNIFTYHIDPAGGIVEVFTDLHRIDNDAEYEPVVWPMAPETLNQWGPAAPQGFFEHLMPAR